MPMSGKVALPMVAIVLSGCAAVPPEGALVHDAVAAIQIGEKACEAKIALIPMAGRRWDAKYSGGIWSVELPHLFPDTPGVGVEVEAMTGKPGACEILVPVE